MFFITYLYNFKGGQVFVKILLIYLCLFLGVNKVLSSNDNAILSPSLLIDVDLNITDPSAVEQFCYQIRYRCVSPTEHCEDAYIDLVLPEGMEVSSLPSFGGNITSVNTSPASPSGTYIRIDLASPATAGLPSNILAAGSSGVLSVCAKWICNDNPVQVPAAGTNINIVGPTFYAVGSSSTATPTSDIAVPVFAPCAPSTNSALTGFNKIANNYTRQTTAGGIFRYQINIDVHDGPITITDSLPDGLCLSEIDADPSWMLEVLCDTTWITIPSAYNSKLSDWLVANENSLDNLLIDPSLPPSPSNETGCAADTLGVSTINGLGYKTDFTGFRLTTPPGPNSNTEINIHTVLDDSVPPGSVLVNCIQTTDSMMQHTCANKELLVTDGPNFRTRKREETGFGDLTIPDEWPLDRVPNYTSLTKQYDDILWRSLGAIPQSNGQNITGFSMTDTLPLGLTFDMDPVDGNWWVVAMPDKSLLPPPYDPFDQPDCINPTFSTSFAADGRMILNWNFNTCTYYAGFSAALEIYLYFTTRFDKTIPLPTSFENINVFNMNDGTPIWCKDGYYGQPSQEFCSEVAISNVDDIGGDINSSKLVNGLLDTSYTRFPNIGLTDTSGIASYKLIIEAASLQGIEKLEILDILSHIGDSTLIARVPRNSEWSTELAGPLLIERFDLITQTWSNASSDIVSELYATTYNPCYLDNVGQVKTAIGLTEPSSAGCSSTDFSATNPVVGAKAFALIWENTTNPLLFGELLSITVPVRQLAGEPDVPNGFVASNSFATTATEVDGDELFSSEPLKADLQMLDLDVNATIGDWIWMDANANGIQDVGELPISGVTVSIFDVAGNPIMAGGNPMTTFSDANGYYSFTGLDVNTDYIIRLDNPDDYINSGVLNNLELTVANANSDDTIDSDAIDSNSGGLFTANFPEIIATTAAGGSLENQYDFGFYQTAIFCGYAWDDVDAQGDQDVSELPMDSVLVEIFDLNGNLMASTTTDNLGVYEFILAPGSYTMQATFQGAGNYVFTNPNYAANDNEDSDVDANGMLGPIVLQGNSYNCNNDIGLTSLPPNPASIIGTVWDELINDGIQSISETGVSGIQVDLLDDAFFVIATTFTDANGDYIFGNLIPNEDYYINVVPGINNPITQFQDAGTDDAIDSDVDPLTGTTIVITPSDNEVVEDVDAGIILPYSLGNQVFVDANNNGVFDNTEQVVAGITLYLLDAATNTYLDTTITDTAGKYVFTNLAPGDYTVELVLPTGLTSSTDIATSSAPNDTDMDDNGVLITNPYTVQSSMISIVAGAGNPTDANWDETDHGYPINGAIDNTSNAKAYYTLDFGLHQKLDCSVPLVEYAITNGAISKPGQTTDYFYPSTVQNLKTYVNHIQQTRQDGVIRCYDFCEFGQWTYYFNPLDPEAYLFAIEHGNNVTPIEYIELRVEDVPADRYAITATDATFVMARDWFVRTVNDDPLVDANGNPATVNIRFYFSEEEFKEILDKAIAQAAAWNGNLPTVADVYWFKKDTFDPATDIDATGSLLKPFDINTLRNSQTSNLGSNTADGIAGQTGNGKNHIQFNGITGFSGGTAAISINRFALPVELTSFDVQANGCDVMLSWSTETETDFSHYIIEKSKDGIDFEYVEKVLALPFEGMKAYSYTDENVRGKVFYRLKIIDLDGTYEFSKIEVVTTDCESQISNLNLYPNPVGLQETNINVSFMNKSESVVWISVSDLLGSELIRFPVDSQLGDNTINLDISNLEVGTYFVTIKKTTGKALAKRFVKINK